MPFVKGDKNINRKGRGTGEKLMNPPSLSKAETKDKELKQILRRLKPLNNKVVSEFEKMFMSDGITEAGKIKLGVFLLKTYQDLINDVYTDNTTPITQYPKDDDKDDEEKEEVTTVSFTVMPNTARV